MSFINKNIVIALTGTPGTGKTSVCNILRGHPEYSKKYYFIDINNLVIGENFNKGKDEESDSYIADIDKLNENIVNQIPDNFDIIMDGHFSHILECDAVIILRTEPIVLRKRLSKRTNYSYKKINENADAEALDVILVEAFENNEYVFEINTTDIDIEDVVKCVIHIIESLKKGQIPQEFLPGKINWIEQVSMFQ